MSCKNAELYACLKFTHDMSKGLLKNINHGGIQHKVYAAIGEKMRNNSIRRIITPSKKPNSDDDGM